MAEKYYFGQGEVHIAPYGSAGNRWVGDVSSLSLSIEVQNIDHFESYSGQRNRARRIPIQTDGTVNLTAHQMDLENLATFLRGTVTEIPASGTASDTYSIPSAATGDVIFLPHVNILTGTGHTFTIQDSKSTPVSLTEGTHYRIDVRFGKIEILALPTGITFPLVVTYKHGTASQMAMLTTQAPVISLTYSGVNLAEGNSPVRVDLYRVSLNPIEELQLISSDAVGEASISGAMEADTTKPRGGALGQMGRILEFAET